MFRQACAVAFAAAITLTLPAGPVVAQEALAEAQALTQATYRRIVELRFDGTPSDVIQNLLARVDLFDPTMNRINEEALTWPEFGALPGVANLETLQMQQLDVDTTVGLGE